MTPRLLVLSNGHGEDLIALRVIEALARLQPESSIAVLALVGEGGTFSGAAPSIQLERLGPSLRLPSGGFSNQSLRGLLQDLAAGLPRTTWHQLQVVRRWGTRGQPILAIGDLLPLAMAWLGGGPYGFIGTPKSDYTWRSPTPPGWGESPLADAYHRLKGSEWDPWEWALMAHRRCRLVAVRDGLTARGLRKHHVQAEAPGNPMMDGFEARALPACLQLSRRVMLLPGSRLPEAFGNLQRLLASLPDSTVCARLGGLTVLVPIGRDLFDSPALASHLVEMGFQASPPPPLRGAKGAWSKGALRLWLGHGCFADWAPWVEVGIATAGTATEQLVGLGVPALSLPGAGPQFTVGFARRQSRLLGGAVQPCRTPEQLRVWLLALLQDSQARDGLGQKGRQRMGSAGGSVALAHLVQERLLGA
ncbi:MAG: lipid-A-disaccharide synthase-related protein [Cyanobium sp.]